MQLATIKFNTRLQCGVFLCEPFNCRILRRRCFYFDFITYNKNARTALGDCECTIRIILSKLEESVLVSHKRNVDDKFALFFFDFDSSRCTFFLLLELNSMRMIKLKSLSQVLDTNHLLVLLSLQAVSVSSANLPSRFCWVAIVSLYSFLGLNKRVRLTDRYFGLFIVVICHLSLQFRSRNFISVLRTDYIR